MYNGSNIASTNASAGGNRSTNLVQNQQGVAIIKTVNVTATPTVAVQATPTVEVNIAKTVVVKPETVSNVTNKTGQIIANLTK